MAHTRPSLREHGLSDQQWRVLRVLGEHGAVETGRVAREAFILGPSLTGVLARMERDGLITREPRCRRPAPHRRRGHARKGRKLVKRLSPPSRPTTTGWRNRWARRSSTQLYALLDELIALEQP